jgi:hypothetical protein
VPAEITISEQPPSETAWEIPAHNRLGAGSLTLLGIALVILFTSLLSPINCALKLGKAIAAGDRETVENLIHVTSVSRCLGEDINPISAQELIEIYSLPPPLRPTLGNWPYGWGSFPDVKIKGLNYRGLSESEVVLSDGMVLAFERTGLWSWRLFCIRHTQSF